MKGERHYEYFSFVVVRYPGPSDGERGKRKGRINQDDKKKEDSAIHQREGADDYVEYLCFLLTLNK